MRVIGLSWTDWATPWSSSKDESVGTIPQLVAQLKDVLKHETAQREQGELPSKDIAKTSAEALANECPAPQFKRIEDVQKPRHAHSSSSRAGHG